MAVSGILLLDKDRDWTSQDCVSKLRGILHERRIGHAGTLDPLATGLLVILVGRATRAACYAEAGSKEYVATIRWGFTTDTQDITGTPLSSEGFLPSLSEVRAALPRFLGAQEQVPPMYSAIKFRGQRLYTIARRGGHVDLPPRKIHIESIDHEARLETGDDVLRIRCSKGTYIRTLCHDIGQLLGCGGCMAALRRTAVGPFSVSDALRISEIAEEAAPSLLPIDSLFPSFGKITLTDGQERKLRCGNPFPFDAENGAFCFYSSNGDFLAVGNVTNGAAGIIKSFFEVN